MRIFRRNTILPHHMFSKAHDHPIQTLIYVKRYQTCDPFVTPIMTAIVAIIACKTSREKLREVLLMKHVFEGRNSGWLTAIVQAMNPGFSRWSTAEQDRITAPAYHGIAARKKPNINLHTRTEIFRYEQVYQNNWLIFMKWPNHMQSPSSTPWGDYDDPSVQIC